MIRKKSQRKWCRFLTVFPGIVRVKQSLSFATGTKHSSPYLRSRSPAPYSHRPVRFLCLAFPCLLSSQIADVKILFIVTESEETNCLANAENSFQLSLGLTKPFKHFCKTFALSKKSLYFKENTMFLIDLHFKH